MNIFLQVQNATWLDNLTTSKKTLTGCRMLKQTSMVTKRCSQTSQVKNVRDTNIHVTNILVTTKNIGCMKPVLVYLLGWITVLFF